MTVSNGKLDNITTIGEEYFIFFESARCEEPNDI